MALPSVRIHARGQIDSTIGIRYGLATQGTLLKSLDYDSTYQWTDHKGHRAAKDTKVGITPDLKVKYTGDVKKLASGLNAKSPGYAFHKSFLTDVYPEIDHGHDVANTVGYWINTSSLKSGQGTLHEVSGELEWWCDANDTVEIVAAPSA